MPGLSERAPFEEPVKHRLRPALIVKPPKVSVIDSEKRRRPRLEPIRTAAGLVDSAQQVENVGGLASLEQSVLLVEGIRDASLTQVPSNLRAIAIGSSKDVNILGRNSARILFLVAK